MRTANFNVQVWFGDMLIQDQEILSCQCCLGTNIDSIVVPECLKAMSRDNGNRRVLIVARELTRTGYEEIGTVEEIHDPQLHMINFVEDASREPDGVWIKCEGALPVGKPMLLFLPDGTIDGPYFPKTSHQTAKLLTKHKPQKFFVIPHPE